MASETGAAPDQIQRAMRSHARWSYTSEANMERAIANGTLSTYSRLDTLSGWAPHLVRPDERIVLASDIDLVTATLRSWADGDIGGNLRDAVTRLCVAIGETR